MAYVNKSSFPSKGPNAFYGRGGGRGGRGRGGGPKAPAKPHVLSGEGAIFPIEVQPKSKAFRYDVSMEFKAPRDDGGVILVSLTTQKRDTRLRVLAYRILSIVMEGTNNFGVPGMAIAYDNQNTLYSSKPFAPVSYNVSSLHLPLELQSYLKGSGNIAVRITPNVEMPVVDISDLSQYDSKDIVLDEDQTVRQVLEIILSQGAIDSGQYDVVGNGQLYRLQEKPIGRGLCTRIGTSKGVKIVEVEDPASPTGKKICPGLIIDFKCSPFYSVKDRNGLPQQNFFEKVMECVGRNPDDPHVWQEASRFFSGIKVVPVYDPHRVLVVKNFDQRTLSQITITIDDGQTMTLPEFFRDKKGCRLDYPHSRAVNICGDKGQFPMELLIILRNQRVSLEKVSPSLRDMVHKANAVIPQERYEKIMEEVSNMSFNNEITQAFGIQVLEAARDLHASQKANDLEFERPPKPTIIVGDGIQIQPNDDGKFDLGKHRYFLPCKIDQWALVYSPECHHDLIDEFLKHFKQAAESRGMRFSEDPERKVFDSRGASFQQWQDLFQKFKHDGTTFVLLIDSKSNTHSHHLLKLMESVSKILTQHVTLEVAQKVVEKYQVLTLGNILLKINVKNGGINYRVQFNSADRLDINKGNTLVISYDVCHPEDRKENHISEVRDPSVVGITANVLLDPSAFIGDFFFQPACQEKVDFNQLRVYVKNLLDILKKNERSLPSIIVILRDGVSEGQFKMTYQEELPAIRQGFKDFDPDYNPEFVFVVCTKRHHKRFFEGENGLFENPQAGSFVNNFTRSDCIEFYMQCHKAIKGTAKFVQVSVVLNEPNVTKQELFGFLHSLSYGHQIVCSPVSLPTPIYQADELAARGFEIYHSVKQYMPHSIRSQNGEMMYAELSALLNYSDTALGNRRFNA